MTSTLAEARDAISSLVTTTWTGAAAGAPLLYDNLDAQETPAGTALWGRLTVQFDEATRASLGNDGGALFRRRGRLYVQVFIPHGKDVTPALSLADTLVRAIERPGHTGNVWFRDVGAEQIGSDGAYWQINIRADFQFDINQ
jgi:hypothetical protein